MIDIRSNIENRINVLSKMRVEIKSRIEKKAYTLSQYDKKLAITIIQLRHGKELELDGEKIHAPQANLIPKIAAGICWEEKLEADKAEADYKSLISNIQCVQAELNGYQSIFRHME